MRVSRLRSLSIIIDTVCMPHAQWRSRMTYYSLFVSQPRKLVQYEPVSGETPIGISLSES